MSMNVTVWHEYRSEFVMEDVAEIYPDGMHNVIKEFLSKDESLNVRTATLDEPMHGLPDKILNTTDVLLWWGHRAHEDVDDEIVEKVKDRVLRGMGLIVLHSAHFSKIFKALMGTSCSLKWRSGCRERIWCCNPSHPIAQGIPQQFELKEEEMYGEFFDIPKPDEIIFLGWFNGGEVFRSGCTFKRGLGKIFYFQPGHEHNPTYYNENIQKIILNAVKWAQPTIIIDEITCPRAQPLEER